MSTHKLRSAGKWTVEKVKAGWSSPVVSNARRIFVSTLVRTLTKRVATDAGEKAVDVSEKVVHVVWQLLN